MERTLAKPALLSKDKIYYLRDLTQATHYNLTAHQFNWFTYTFE